MIKLGFSSKKFFSKLSEEFQSCFFLASLELGGCDGKVRGREERSAGGKE